MNKYIMYIVNVLFRMKILYDYQNNKILNMSKKQLRKCK